MNEVKLGKYTISEIEEPVCPNYASARTRSRFDAWAKWNGYGRRPGYPAAALKKDKLAAKGSK